MVSIKVDEGAYRSLLRNGSLLPIGIKKIKGPFKRGDSVAIQFKNKTFAYGLCDYDSKDILKIMGKKSFEIEDILGFLISDVVIHRDNMILNKLKPFKIFKGLYFMDVKKPRNYD